MAVRDSARLRQWYETAVADLQRFIREIPIEPDRYQQRFYLHQTLLRFKDYWEERIRELERRERKDRRSDY